VGLRSGVSGHVNSGYYPQHIIAQSCYMGTVGNNSPTNFHNIHLQAYDYLVLHSAVPHQHRQSEKTTRDAQQKVLSDFEPLQFLLRLPYHNICLLLSSDTIRFGELVLHVATGL
jgi:hypothetical protein